MSYESIYPRTPVGTLEIKALPSRTTLVAAAAGDAFADRGAAFRKLFSYINSNGVAMSVPIEASASVNEMLFLVGSNSMGRALVSANGVTVQTVSGTTVASIGLRGGYSRANYEKGLKRLKGWLALQPEWRVSDEPYAVYWNSPFVPPFLRKSEIHLPVTRAAGAAPPLPAVKAALSPQ